MTKMPKGLPPTLERGKLRGSVEGKKVDWI